MEKATRSASPDPDSALALRDMSEKDIEEACRVIAESMNGDEARWAERTMGFHFGCSKHGLYDGRHYFVYSVDGRVKALVGLHHWEWGPKENVWLAWFAVEPGAQNKGIGKALLQSAEALARRMGFLKLFVETYSQPEFEKARQFYKASGFEEAGQIKDYLPGSHDMIVFSKNLF